LKEKKDPANLTMAKQDSATEPIAIASSTSYFAGEEGLIEEFQFDYNLLNAFDQKLVRTNGIFFLASPCIAPCIIPYMYACEVHNVVDRNNATHVCITQDGIRYSVDKRSAGCRRQICEEGKTMKTVPFDKITDCDIEEPAGNTGCCWLVPNTVTVVNVDTASGSRGPDQNGLPSHELVIRGLVDPHAFKSLVWKMKRAGHGTPHSANMVVGAAKAPGNVQMSRTPSSELAPLLRKQNALLTEQNKVLNEHTNLLKSIAKK
jgi:hypothetical protein